MAMVVDPDHDNNNKDNRAIVVEITVCQSAWVLSWPCGSFGGRVELESSCGDERPAGAHSLDRLLQHLPVSSITTSQEDSDQTSGCSISSLTLCAFLSDSSPS